MICPGLSASGPRFLIQRQRKHNVPQAVFLLSWAPDNRVENVRGPLREGSHLPKSQPAAARSR